jgi:hypothetical protein
LLFGDLGAHASHYYLGFGERVGVIHLGEEVWPGLVKTCNTWQTVEKKVPRPPLIASAYSDWFMGVRGREVGNLFSHSLHGVDVKLYCRRMLCHEANADGPDGSRHTDSQRPLNLPAGRVAPTRILSRAYGVPSHRVPQSRGVQGEPSLWPTRVSHQ